MRKLLSIALLFCAVLAVVSPAIAAESTSALQVVRDFYQRYMAYSHTKNWSAPRPKMAFSTTFAAEIAKTDAMCRALSDGGPCGWGADGDVYLDSQEIDPNLSFRNSGMEIKEISPGVVQARFNVYPSIKDAEGYYRKRVTYKMVLEGGKWLVDDVIDTGEISARKAMADEQAYLRAYPRDAK